MACACQKVGTECGARGRGGKLGRQGLKVLEKGNTSREEEKAEGKKGRESIHDC